MLHCAAMLNATSVSFLSIFLDADHLASIRTGGGILLLLCLLATVWILIWYFLRAGRTAHINYAASVKGGNLTIRFPPNFHPPPFRNR